MSGVILTGCMGTGKATLGRLLAKRSKPFNGDEHVEILTELRSAPIFATIASSRSFERLGTAGPRVCLVADVGVFLVGTASNTNRPLLVRSYA